VEYNLCVKAVANYGAAAPIQGALAAVKASIRIKLKKNNVRVFYFLSHSCSYYL